MHVDKKEIGKRIKSVLAMLGYKHKEVAELAEIPYSSLQNWILGISYPNAVFLAWLAKQNVNINWILTGEGEIFLHD